MVGIFSRFNVTRGSHRRSQSAIDERAGLQPSAEAVAATAAAVAAAHGLEVALEFKPVEHPVEPFDNDQPVKCPLPEPSILNDGRIWKERFSANTTRGSEFSSTNEGASEATGITKSRSSNSNRLILPSLSAPEHNLINLLEEWYIVTSTGHSEKALQLLKYERARRPRNILPAGIDSIKFKHTFFSTPGKLGYNDSYTLHRQLASLEWSLIRWSSEVFLRTTKTAMVHLPCPPVRCWAWVRVFWYRRRPCSYNRLR